MESLKSLLAEIRACRVCEPHLQLGAAPVLVARESAPILIVGQAPGIRVHKSGVPWDDPSGNRLRDWMGIDSQQFYDEALVAIVPMGFCYPGKGRSGDLPPRTECAQLWHKRLLGHLGSVRLTLLVGRYAQAYMLADKNKSTLTANVKAWKEFTPSMLPLPHPSPRNNRWLRTNPWFEKEVVPFLRKRVARLTRSAW